MSSGASTGSVNITLSGNWNLVEAVNSSGTSNVTTVYNCGTSNASNTTTLTPVPSTITGTLYVNGRGGTATNSVAGKFGELLVFSNALTDTQRQSVEGYLAWKWGLHVQVPAPVQTPLSISGCTLWLDASSTANFTFATSPTIATWIDRSGSGNTATPFGPGTTVTYSSSSNAVYFPGSAGVKTSLVTPTNRVQSGFFVATVATGTGLNAGVIQGCSNSYGGREFRTTGTLTSLKENTIGLLTSGTTPVNTLMLVGYTDDGTTITHSVNGTTTSGTSATAFTSGTTVTLGYSFNTEYMVGYINEAIIYSNALSSTQRQSVENYLMGKWGIKPSLPAIHPFYSIPSFSRPFQPIDVPGCALWLDGADASTMNSTTTVTSWTDKSGLGNTMAGTATVSGSNMTFNGSTQAFSNTTFVFPSSNYSMFAVYSNTTAPASTAYMNVVYGSGGYPMVGVYGSSKFVSARSVVANTGALSPNVAASNVLVSATYTPSTFSPFINGSAETTLAGTTLAATGIYVGGPSNYFNGSISEILIYSSNLSTTQRQQVEGYLAAKWGLLSSVVSGHPFKSIPPSTSQPPQFQEVTPGNWTYDWQPYLSNLTRANNSANSTVIPTVAYGTGGASLSPALSTQYYLGGVLAPNGTIYGIPNASSNILMINTATNGVSYGTGGPSLSPALSTQYYRGGVLAPNGNIYCSPTLSSNILIINTSDNSVSYGTGGPSLSPALSTQVYRGGVLAPNGNIYGMPNLSSNILIINTTTNGVSYGTGGPSLSPALSTQYYTGGVLAPNGNIYGMPNGSSNILIINTNTNGVSYGTGGPSLSPALSTQYYSGAILAPNGTIYGMPNGASNILIINTSTNSVSYGTGGPSLSPALSTQYYVGGVLAPNGNIYCIPYLSSNILIINTTTNGVSYGTNSLSPALSTQGYFGGVLAPNGTIYGIPYLSSNILRISNTYTETPSSNYCLSAWTNKL